MNQIQATNQSRSLKSRMFAYLRLFENWINLRWNKSSAKRPIGRPMVVGLLSAPMGLGAGARYIYAGLSELNFFPSSLDVTAVIQPDRSDLDWKPQSESVDDGKGPIIIHVNPPELPIIFSSISHKVIKHRFLIGYWAWELPIMDPSWRKYIKLFDEIWVPSRFVAKAVAQYSSTPVHVIGYPVAVTEQHEKIPVQHHRQNRGKQFIILCACDVRSSTSRKNPKAAIAAFQAAFADNSNVKLVIKCSTIKDASSNEIVDIVQQANDTRIEINDNVLCDIEFDDLISKSDVFISLHRSEGFGLTIAKSLILGVPVIVTNWSGNTDFSHCSGVWPISYKLVDAISSDNQYSFKAANWAEPNINHAASILRYIFNQSILTRCRMASRIKEDAKFFFSSSEFAKNLSRSSASFKLFEAVQKIGTKT